MKSSLIIAISLSLINSSPLFGSPRAAGSQSNKGLDPAKQPIKATEAKPFENAQTGGKEEPGSLFNLKASANALGARGNIDSSLDPPPIDSIFDPNLWNGGKDQDIYIPVGPSPRPGDNNGGSKVPGQITPQLPPTTPGNGNNEGGKNPPPTKPNPSSSGTDQIKKAALGGFSSIFSPIRPIFHTLDVASHTSMEGFSKFSDQIPVLNELVNSSKQDGLRNAPGYNQFRSIMDTLIVAVFSLPIISPSLSADNNNGTSLDIISQAGNEVNSFKTSQFGPDLAVESLITNNNITSSINNSTSFIKPIDNKSGQGESNDNLLSIQLSLGVSGNKNASNSTPNATEMPMPPINSIFDQNQWNEANSEVKIPLKPNNVSKNSNFLNPLAYKSPQHTSNILDLNLQIRKLTLPGISDLLSQIRPLFGGIDKYLQLNLVEVAKLTNNLPALGPLLNQLKSEGILNMSGYSEFRNLMDSLIILGDLYRDGN
ncbi:hypothetical protein CONCODRAFT_4273 [Conidiobolus coronatus NRRL 28638]|uniref:Uncharacterized protein n=1 Tax=Conidiobolus coronatus (strain ATCC 28846 / CBS 209.66 / NRRL 28638) TaxID=796925 RepID=A0A137PCZ6_CONC2|nr:hypothetical protein CONCODRAFT_4273 [Conidiobolus coronatus NRRL 28638]|eukprot:KXN72878.1 hypothetical protein CONCODRAFT_4273 [Conidiobolus coronatus NRRL 28638]